MFTFHEGVGDMNVGLINLPPRQITCKGFKLTNTFVPMAGIFLHYEHTENK